MPNYKDKTEDLFPPFSIENYATTGFESPFIPAKNNTEEYFSQSIIDKISEDQEFFYVNTNNMATDYQTNKIFNHQTTKCAK